MEFKEQLNKLFKELRKKGYVARQNFSCCGSCASYELGEMGAKKSVFYTRQDTERLRDGRKECYLNWDGDGSEIASVAQEIGLKVNWNGKEEQKIQVFAN